MVFMSDDKENRPKGDTYTLHIRSWEHTSGGYLYDSRILVLTAKNIDDLRKRMMRDMKYPKTVDEPPYITVWKGMPDIWNPPTSEAGSVASMYVLPDRKSVVWACKRTKKAYLVDRVSGKLIT